MERDIARMVEATGVAIPLAGRIVGIVLDSGASQIEILTALDVVRIVLSLLPAPVLAEDVGAPELRPSA